MIANTEIVIVRPNIEHQMLGIIMGQGGPDLGHTLWGQTELSCYDDSMHGIWGMSYKYHERAIVFNEKNLVRLWDVAYDGYVGGKDDTHVDWKDHEQFQNHTNDIGTSYRGPSMMVMAFVHDGKDGKNEVKRNWPSPIVFHEENRENMIVVDPTNARSVDTASMRVFRDKPYTDSYKAYKDLMPSFTTLHQTSKPAGMAAVENETTCNAFAFQGTMKVLTKSGQEIEHIQGSGHHGPDWVGVASVRAGKGYKSTGAPSLQRMI